MISAYARLLALGKELQLVNDSAALLGWDQEVLLPPRGIAYRAEQMSWFSGYVHERFIAASVGEWIAEAESGLASEDPIAEANCREWRHEYQRATCLPTKLVEELAEARVHSQAAWAEARKRSDFSHFAPHLEKLVELSREHAERWGYQDQLYDALIDRFERGATARALGATLGDLRASLLPVVEAATSRPPYDRSRLRGDYPVERQKAFNREVAESIGFDFEAGRIDTAVHPFCSGMAPYDTRLTTRYDETDFLSSLFGVLHEVGHGLYEQGLPKEWRGQPVGNSVSLGVHESQSRLWENHVGRSRGFWERWLPRAVHYFPHLGGLSPADLYAAVNQAERSHIRVEADEVTYDLHILLRFEIECAIFGGDLAIADIPAEWNRRFESFFGVPVRNDAEGCLQDIHWSMGIFGYFPTYSLGNLNAAHLARAAKTQDSAVAKAFEAADYAPLLAWMRKHLHEAGSLHLPNDLVARAAGTPVSAEALVSHLRERYLDEASVS
ncbi:MAG: carboxypeptidase [Verrucomicrobiia bacterium Tous-C2TDCM]|nr:MAG: carboxypeptidase [Verrucomicrobiae bacterium Tous-C2TDCM]